MSNYLRPRMDGACVFITMNLAKRGARLLVDRVDILREAVLTTQINHPFHVDAWVVLPDHMHAVWTLPNGDADYSTRVASIKAQFSMRLRRAGFSPPTDLPVVQTGRYAGLKPGLRAHKRELGIWKRRFWEHHIRDARDYENHVRYCLLNPVKHGLCERAVDWPYSSIHRDIRLGRVDAQIFGGNPRGCLWRMKKAG